MNRRDLVRQTAEVPVGGSEDETSQRVKDLFRKSLDVDSEYRHMSDEDIEALEEAYAESLQME